jgi:hypothetical protein
MNQNPLKEPPYKDPERPGIKKATLGFMKGVWGACPEERDPENERLYGRGDS